MSIIIKDLIELARLFLKSVLISAIFLINLFLSSEILATSPSPSPSVSPSPSPSPFIKITSTDPQDNIVKGTSFKVGFSVENVGVTTDYYAKFGLDKSTEWKGKTHNNEWISFTGGGSSWDKFPKFTSDNAGKFTGTLEVITSDSTQEGVNNINVKIAKANDTSNAYNSYNYDQKQLNIILPSPSPSPSPSLSPQASPSPTPSPSIASSPSPSQVSIKPSVKTIVPSSSVLFSDKPATDSGQVLGLLASNPTASPELQKSSSKKLSIIPIIISSIGSLMVLGALSPYIIQKLKNRSM